MDAIFNYYAVIIAGIHFAFTSQNASILRSLMAVLLEFLNLQV